MTRHLHHDDANEIFKVTMK